MNPWGRLSSRVEYCQRYRPGYPDAAPEALAGVPKPGCVVADIGPGAGISSRWLRRRVAKVCGVEPHRAMRKAADELPGFVSIDGQAEGGRASGWEL